MASYVIPTPKNRKGLGFVHAPLIEPGAQKKTSLPVWVRKIIESWWPRLVDPFKASHHHAPALSDSFAQDYGSAAMDFTGKDVDGRLDELTQRILLDGAVCKQASRLVRRAVKDNFLPVTFCAGRISALGSLSGHAMGKAETGILDMHDASSVCLIWLDLFANMDSRIADYAEYSTRCPACFLIHELFPAIPRDFPGFEWIRPWLSVTRTAVIGLQNPSVNEIRFLEENRIESCTLDNLHSRGAEDCVSAALMSINPRNDLPIHLAINIFAMDYKIPVQGAGPRAGYLQIPDVLAIIEAVLQTGRLGAVDFLEVDQILAEDIHRATEVINQILKRVSLYVKRETAPMSFDF